MMKRILALVLAAALALGTLTACGNEEKNSVEEPGVQTGWDQIAAGTKKAAETQTTPEFSVPASLSETNTLSSIISSGRSIWYSIDSKSMYDDVGKDSKIRDVVVFNNGEAQVYPLVSKLTVGEVAKMTDDEIIAMLPELVNYKTEKIMQCLEEEEQILKESSAIDPEKYDYSSVEGVELDYESMNYYEMVEIDPYQLHWYAEDMDKKFTVADLPYYYQEDLEEVAESIRTSKEALGNYLNSFSCEVGLFTDATGNRVTCGGVKIRYQNLGAKNLDEDCCKRQTWDVEATEHVAETEAPPTEKSEETEEPEGFNPPQYLVDHQDSTVSGLAGIELSTRRAYYYSPDEYKQISYKLVEDLPKVKSVKNTFCLKELYPVNPAKTEGKGQFIGNGRNYQVYDSWYGGFYGFVTRVPAEDTTISLDGMDAEDVVIDPADWGTR